MNAANCVRKEVKDSYCFSLNAPYPPIGLTRKFCGETSLRSKDFWQPEKTVCLGRICIGGFIPNLVWRFLRTEKPRLEKLQRFWSMLLCYTKAAGGYPADLCKSALKSYFSYVHDTLSMSFCLWMFNFFVVQIFALPSILICTRFCVVRRMKKIREAASSHSCGKHNKFFTNNRSKWNIEWKKLGYSWRKLTNLHLQTASCLKKKKLGKPPKTIRSW